eukprot:TRINITY_DN35581_c0_g1_i1.p1 TRINITY_DN35581_c0_g1~~TRINITY_DN35581_c0_g1_i1.p1  ORF type:complete len:509 (+),score=108.83 TRINITY_DN35581_c0_g1_i1:95-1621(+)
MGVFQEPAPNAVNASMMGFGAAFAVCVSMCFLVLLWRNWKSEELRVRGKVMTITSFFGILVLACFFVYLTAKGFDDSIQTVLVLWVFATPCELAFVSGPVMIRGLVLLFKYEVIAEQIRIMRSAEEDEVVSPVKLSWYSRNRHLVSEKFQLGYQIGFSVICLAIPVATAPFSYSTFVGSSRISNILIFFASGLVMVFCAIKSKTAVDYWRMKQELEVIGLASFAGALQFIVVVYLAVPKSHITWKPFLEVLGHFIWLFGIFVPIALFRPLMQSEYARRYGSLPRDMSTTLPSLSRKRSLNSKENLTHSESDKYSTSSASLPDFYSVLKSPLLLKLLQDLRFEEVFRVHLNSEFSPENLFYFTQVRKLYQDIGARLQASERGQTLTVDDCKLVMREAEFIHETFIEDGAPSWVNLSVLRDDIVEDFSELKKRFFEFETRNEQHNFKDFCTFASQIHMRGAQEVLKLMEHDSFRRFKLTAEFKAYNARRISVLVIEGRQDAATVVPIPSA